MGSDVRVRLFCYKMIHDSGFAPNPYHGVMTLATCKPGIRRTKGVGDWVAGFSSKALNSDPVGNERLVYLMMVDKVLPLGDYFDHPEYRCKRPLPNDADVVSLCGDNIYKPLCDNAGHAEDFQQIKNYHHYDEYDNEYCRCNKVGYHQTIDISGVNVLIARKEFFYFGRGCLTLPEELRPNIPIGPSQYGSLTDEKMRIADFVTFVKKQYKKMGDPHIKMGCATRSCKPHAEAC